MDSPPPAATGARAKPLANALGWLAAGAVVGAAGLFLVEGQFHRREATAALRGEAAAQRQGCFQCHGPEGRGGVADPGARAGVIPGWDGPTVAALVASERELRQWVLEGRPDRLKAVDAGLRRDPAVPMPAYRGRLSERELGDILVYFRAVSNFGADMPEAVYEGWKAADKMGCFGCHGPGGAGGRPNPGSFKGHIPAWDGAEFRELSRDEGELREWILNGYPERLWRNPAARLFLEHQVVQMPAYRRHLTTVQTDQLVAYVQWLRKGTRNKSGGEEGSEIIALIGAPGGHP